MGTWYTIGLCLGLGLGLSVAITGILGTNVLGVGAAAVVGAILGGSIGLLIGDTTETVAGAIGGVLGALSAAAVVVGALRRGATRFGVGAYMGALGVLVCLVALIPIAWARRFDVAMLLVGVVSIEVIVLALNAGRCPLTAVAARYTDDRRDNFDIYLPEWLAHYNKPIFTVLLLIGLLVTLVRRIW